ncbi:hypothetical protein [Burkholderia ambifaria]|jgi:hypothetical protein|uniref:hypothetical protein n=1 Tax=Burkholderia ambifaria TaxID=152480 RepID=UPI00158AE197|nr:hypothetical protein [Burkholderia ambifaria]
MTEPILTRDKILEALTMPGLNVEASLEPREVGLLCVAIGDLFKQACVEPRAEVPHGKRDAAPLIKTMSDIIHDQTVAMQSAIIEWRHGKGAEAGMSWIVNTLEGPGHLPDFDAPHGKHAQFWFNANQANPLPTCFCGNPSSSLWMGQGFCCDEHYREAKATYDANRIRGG